MADPTTTIKVKILLLESDAAVSAQAAEACAVVGASLARVEDSEEAMAILKKESVDLLMVDLNLSGNQGINFIQAVAQHRDLKIRAMPILGLVGRKAIAVERLVIELGGFHLTDKPFTVATLANDLRRVLDERAEQGRNGKADETRIFMRKILVFLARTGEYAKAVSAIQSKMFTVAGSAPLTCFLGGLQLDEGELDKAARNADAALNIDPNFIPALNLKAKLAVFHNDFKGALVWMEKASTLSPLNVARFLSMGEIHLAYGRLGEAEDKFRRALAVDAGCVDAKIGLAKTMIEAGRPEGDKLLKELPDPRVAISQVNLRAVLLAKCGRYQEAISLYEKAIKYASGEGAGAAYAIRYNMALGYMKMGKVDKAKDQAKLSKGLKHNFAKCTQLIDIIQSRQNPFVDAAAEVPTVECPLSDAQIAFLRGVSSSWKKPNETETKVPATEALAAATSATAKSEQDHGTISDDTTFEMANESDDETLDYEHFVS